MFIDLTENIICPIYVSFIKNTTFKQHICIIDGKVLGASLSLDDLCKELHAKYGYHKFDIIEN